MEYHKRLKYARNKLGYTQKQMGELLDINWRYYGNVESGREDRRLSRELEDKICDEAGLSPAFFSSQTLDIFKLEETKEEIFLSLFPEAKNVITYDRVREIIKQINGATKEIPPDKQD